MEDFKAFIDYLVDTRILSVCKALLLILAGYFLGRLASAASVRIFQKKLTVHGIAILRRVSFYGIFILLAVSALRELGFDLSVVLGAAGILTVAIGFASQTSASNLISGLFLMIERPFSIGDIIKVNATTGEVISIDSLSIKLRTFDNLFVRIPNETMIKSEVTTLTRYPIRRIDLQIGIAYKEDLEKVESLLNDVADANPLCLDEPVPLFIILTFGASSIDIQFSVWTKRENVLKVKNSMLTNIKKTFEQHDIEIPFPHTSLYAGSASRPMPITIVEPKNASQTNAECD